MAKKKKKFVMECARYITDFRGHEICPGNVVGVGRSGRGSRQLEAYIVTAVRKGTVTYAGLDFDYKYNHDYTDVKITILGAKPVATYSQLFGGEIQEHIVVVDNPLYAIHNPQIKSIIDIATHLKEGDLFPEDYKLGNSVMEYQEPSSE